MQTGGDEMFKELEKIASGKGIGVQTLLRAVIIPEWVQREGLSMDPGENPSKPQTSNKEKRREDLLQGLQVSTRGSLTTLFSIVIAFSPSR